MIVTYDDMFQWLEDKTIDNTKELKKTRRQRRTEFTDLYGVPYTAIGDRGTPAQFYISISNDLVYYLRFQFKLHIQPFLSTVSGGTDGATVIIDPTSLSVSNSQISPNPHNHTAQPHTHNTVSGVGVTHTTSTDFTVKIHGVDITPYLMEQQGGAWINGEGLYPSNQIADEDDFYDVLDVAGMMTAEGNLSDRAKLLQPEFKLIEIESDAPFAVTLYLYLKYSNPGR